MFINNYKLLVIIITSFINLNGCRSKDDSTFYPGTGVGHLKLGEASPENVTKELVIFQTENGLIDFIYTEDEKFRLNVSGHFIKINDKFSNLDDSIKKSLLKDSTSKDKFGSDWFTSNEGYMISVKYGVINGLGILPKNHENQK